MLLKSAVVDSFEREQDASCQTCCHSNGNKDAQDEYL